MPRKRALGSAVLLFFISLTCFPPRGWTEFYRSNEMGIVFEGIEPIRTDEYPYYVRIFTEEDREIKILYHRGEPARRWVKTRLDTGEIEVIEYREGTAEKATRYDRRERPVEIRSYEEGSLTERTVYTYVDERISSTARYDGEGNILERLEYGHDTKGRLREYRELLEPEQEGTPKISRSRYLYSSGTIREEWHGDELRGDMFRYNESGGLIVHEGWREGRLVVRTTRTYTEEGKILFSRTADFEEETVNSDYYEEGRIVRERRETEEGNLIEESTYTYGPGGNIIGKNRRAPGVRESWEYAYTGGELQRSVYRRGGTIAKITEYRKGDHYVETIYRHGEPLVAVEYENGKRVGEVPVR